MVQSLAAWVGFPLAFAALCVGWGLLIEVAAGRALPCALVPGAGFAGLIVALALPGFTHSTAPAASGLAVAGAMLGWTVAALGRGPRSGLPRGGGWTVAAAAGAFVLYLAPTLFSGHPGVGGYIRLDDSATWTVLGDYVLRHGYDLSGLPPSSHNSALASYLPGHYPVGAFLPLAATSRLIGTDIAWCYASYLASVGALLALALRELVRPAIAHPAARSTAAVVAAGSGLLYGYVGWGGVKEVVAAALVATLAALAPGAVAVSAGAAPARLLRGLLPVGITCAAALSALSVGAGAWIVPVLLPAFVVAVRRLGPHASRCPDGTPEWLASSALRSSQSPAHVLL